MALIMLQLSVLPSAAIMVTSSMDNTVLPADDRGQRCVGMFNNVTGVVIATNAFVTCSDLHIGGEVGDQFVIGGVSYTTVSKTNDPGVPYIDGTTRWTISGTFPADRISPIWTNASFVGVQVACFGRGVQKGPEIWKSSSPVNVEDISVSNGVVSFYGVGGTVGASCTVQFTTNVESGIWLDIPGTYTVPEDEWFPVSFPQPACAQAFFRIKAGPVLMGFELWDWTGALSYGMNHIEGADYYEDGTYLLWFTMKHNGCGPEECGTSPGDSSGAVFGKDVDGKWKLIGLIYSGYVGPFAYDLSYQPLFSGTMFDISGLYAYGSLYPFPEGYGTIAPKCYLSPIPVAWLKAEANKKH